MIDKRIEERVGSVPMLTYKSRLIFTRNLLIYTKTGRDDIVVKGGHILLPALTSSLCLLHTGPLMPNGLEE